MTSQKRMIQEELLKLRVGDCGVRWGTVVWKITQNSYQVGSFDSASLIETVDYIYDHI